MIRVGQDTQKPAQRRFTAAGLQMRSDLRQSHEGKNPNNSAQDSQKQKGNMPAKLVRKVEAQRNTRYLSDRKRGHDGSYRRGLTTVRHEISDHRQTDTPDNPAKKTS